MREVLLRTAADSRRVPWRNGRGVTEELAIWPAGARFERDDWEWRVAKARVEAAGPFSEFPGCERILAVTDGAGLVLAHGPCAPRARLRPLEPYRFDGGWPTTAELVAGPVADLSVLVRRGALTADLAVTRIGARRVREVVGPGHAFVHALACAATVRVPGEEEPLALAPGASVWIRALAAPEEIEVAGAAAAAVVALVRVGPGSGEAGPRGGV